MKRSFLFLFVFLGYFSVAQHKTVDILSWNVFLRPGFLMDGQLKRVDSIAHYLVHSDADILVLQEVFHGRARRRLINSIKTKYPYYTKKGKTSFFGVPSGVLICSKYPVKQERAIYFKRAIKADKLARKGGIFVEIDLANTSFEVIGTHLQAGGGKEGMLIRKQQLKELLALRSDDKKPVVYAGDFNISYNSESYDDLVKILSGKNKAPEGAIKNTANFSDHDLTNAKGKPKWIDFILTSISKRINILSSKIEQPMFRPDGTLERLSDHNPIRSTIELNVPTPLTK